MSAGWITSQILRMTDGRNAMRLERPSYNPRPPGVIRDGSTTSTVLSILERHPKRFFTSGELMALTGRSHSAVSWALIYLRDVLKAIDTAGDPRNSNYRRYRLKARRTK